MKDERWGDGDDDLGPDWNEQAMKAGWINPDDHEKAVLDIMAERRRQISEEGFLPEKDDAYDAGQLVAAAATYALEATFNGPGAKGVWFSQFWPWKREWWKPKGARRDLVRAGALIAAEIARIDRAEALETKRFNDLF